MMADNLAYMVSREKVLAFAHNSRLKRGKAQWQLGADLLTWWPAGSHPNEMFGSRYAVIGTAVGVFAANGIIQPEASQSFTDFDWLAVLDSTAYNRGGPPLQ